MLEFVAELRERPPFYNAVWRGFRSERFKYTVKGDKFGAEPWQFFDLENDPYEMRNLIEDPAWADEIGARSGRDCLHLEAEARQLRGALRAVDAELLPRQLGSEGACGRAALC